PSRAGLLAAAIVLVDGGPGAALGLLVGNAAILVAFLDMLGLALLLVGIGTLVALGHVGLLKKKTGRGAGGTRASIGMKIGAGNRKNRSVTLYHHVRLTRAGPCRRTGIGAAGCPL